jgi:hypothetical protein
MATNELVLHVRKPTSWSCRRRLRRVPELVWYNPTTGSEERTRYRAGSRHSTSKVTFLSLCPSVCLDHSFLRDA